MKTKRTSTSATTERAKPRLRTFASILCLGAVFSILVASVFYTVSSASSKSELPKAARSAQPVPASKINHAGVGNSENFRMKWFSPLLLPPAAEDTIATYEVVSGACTNTPKTTFLLGDGVCVKASATLGETRLSVSGTDATVAAIVDVTTDPQELIYTLPATTTSVVNDSVVDNRGVWRATVHSNADFGSGVVAFFSVKDPANAAADLVVFADSTATDTVSPGSPTSFVVYLANDGPDDAAGVHVTQNVPADMTFNSATAGSGVGFTCTENAGLVDCEPSGSLASGATSTFTLNYTVSGGAPNSIVTTEVDISSTTTDPRLASNASVAKVEIRDAGSPPPTCFVSCPLNRTVSANTIQSGQPGAVVTFAGDIETSGDCGTVSSSPASGSFFSVAGSPHTVMVNSTTGGGSCSFSITVTETAAPTITCAADQTATTSGPSNEAIVSINTPTATGTNVQITGVRNDNRALSDGYPVGTTTITWTAAECNNPPDCDDPNARTVSCTQLITVTSPDAPTISCPSNKTFPAEDCAGKTLTAGDIGTPTATGSNVTITSRRNDDLDLTGDPYPVGITTITWTATDDGGRIASCTQTVTITSSGADNVPPTLNVPAGVSATTSSCTATIDDELGVATAEDNCGTVSISRTGMPMFACPIPGDPGRQCESFVFPTGTTIITYTATDNAGNVTVGTQSVIVTESPAVNPTITAPGPVSVSTGPGATSCGAFVSDATLGNATTNDNCPGVTVSRTGVPAGNNFPVGTTVVTYTATDASGNTAQATQNVTVTDDTAPIITAPGPVTLFTGPGATSCDVTVSDLNTTLGAGSATDNCPGVTWARSGGNVFPLGNTTVTYTATDAYGNTATADQTVTVVDNTPPVVTPPANITVQLPPNSSATSMAVNYPNPATATDNCGGSITITYSPPSGSTFPVGPTTVTVTATDAHNNSATATFTVTVLYNFTGFFSPVGNPPIINNVNAGRSIPLKFSLSGNKGLGIFAAGYPASQEIACNSSAPLSNLEGTDTPGDSTLTYSPDQYHYNWKTEKAWEGTCRQLVVRLNDGSEHVALFKFK